MFSILLQTMEYIDQLKEKERVDFRKTKNVINKLGKQQSR